MATAKKIEEVAELTDILNRSTVLIGADYRGLKVSDATALRSQLREAGIEMRVVKNTLFRRAADAAGKSDIYGLADGPTALLAGFADPIAPIKTIIEYQRTARNPSRRVRPTSTGRCTPPLGSPSWRPCPRRKR